MKLRVLVVFAFLLTATASWTEEASERPSDWDRFRLWDRCRPMDLRVYVDEGATAIGLTEETVTAAVRSRLRAARLYENGSESEFFAGVQMLGFAFQVNVYPSVAENFRWRVRSAQYLRGFRSHVPCSLGSPPVTLNHSL